MKIGEIALSLLLAKNFKTFFYTKIIIRKILPLRRILVSFNFLFIFLLDQKERKNQESIIAAAQATLHRMLSILTRCSERMVPF